MTWVTHLRLNSKEKEEVVANCDNLKSLKFSPHLPYAFTEHGAIMLSSVLNSEQAINVNIHIVRAFTKLRETILMNNDILKKIEDLEKVSNKNVEDIRIVFTYLKKLVKGKEQPETRKIGFKIKEI